MTKIQLTLCYILGLAIFSFGIGMKIPHDGVSMFGFGIIALVITLCLTNNISQTTTIRELKNRIWKLEGERMSPPDEDE